jgi:hypothetical protein
MNLSEKEQEFVDHVRKVTTQFGNCGGSNFEKPKTRDEHRTRKLIDNGILLSLCRLRSTN